MEIFLVVFQSLVDQGEDFQLIDVREPYEYEISNLEGTLIPLANLTSQVDKIDRNRRVIIYCRSGRRSADAIRELEQLYQFDNLFNLKGGINAFAKEIDNSIPTY